MRLPAAAQGGMASPLHLIPKGVVAQTATTIKYADRVFMTGSRQTSRFPEPREHHDVAIPDIATEEEK
ncbi:hypothetical protein A6D6_00869 [Alcanivorax xiamenensis]|uniref:Uncharacterized protein n=1 Tax=Alcanivorax xiamenensis TaxID=1177156 RepID=A0ABQ6YBB6_9GAMM|nr:hypothetical protein A6D6_00869 [Alcanivorax xiamenensis]